MEQNGTNWKDTRKNIRPVTCFQRLCPKRAVTGLLCGQIFAMRN